MVHEGADTVASGSNCKVEHHMECAQTAGAGEQVVNKLVVGRPLLCRNLLCKVSPSCSCHGGPVRLDVGWRAGGYIFVMCFFLFFLRHKFKQLQKFSIRVFVSFQNNNYIACIRNVLKILHLKYYFRIVVAVDQ